MVKSTTGTAKNQGDLVKAIAVFGKTNRKQ
jgi:hypothetical protein